MEDLFSHCPLFIVGAVGQRDLAGLAQRPPTLGYGIGWHQFVGGGQISSIPSRLRVMHQLHDSLEQLGKDLMASREGAKTRRNEGSRRA
jgi:hypothetical protein